MMDAVVLVLFAALPCQPGARCGRWLESGGGLRPEASSRARGRADCRA